MKQDTESIINAGMKRVLYKYGIIITDLPL